MKMHYTELKNRSRLLQSLTGLNTTEFKALLPSFSAAWDTFVEDTFENKKRKRGRGAGRKAELSDLEDKLLFILVYFRQYPAQEVQGYLFGIRQAQANQWIHRLTGVLNQALGDELQLPERRPAKLKEVLSACPELVFMIDGTERPIEGKATTTERHYYLTSLGRGVERFAQASRGHWGIENGLRWSLDVVFDEDGSRIRNHHAPENMTLIRKIALNLLTKEPSKGSKKRKRLKAGWDNDFLIQVLLS